MTEPLTDREHIAEWMLAYLKGHRGWCTRATLQRERDYTDKQCQRACADSKAQIISGQRGYRASIWATTEELQDVLNANTDVIQAATRRNNEILDEGWRQGRWM